MQKHYAPRTPLELVAGSGQDRVAALCRQGLRVGWITSERRPAPSPVAALFSMPEDSAGYAAQLYAALHQLDKEALDRIVVDLPPATDEWLAIHDRLRRAAHS